MTLQKVPFERLSVLSSRPFEAVLAALKTALAQPNIAEFTEAAKGARTFAELEQVVREALGGKEFMIFMELDEGEILRRERLDRPKIVRLLIGNPLIMKDMVKHVPDVDPMLRSRCSSTRGPTGCMCRTTKWPVFWPATQTRTRSPSLPTSMRKSRPLFETVPAEEGVCRCANRVATGLGPPNAIKGIDNGRAVS